MMRLWFAEAPAALPIRAIPRPTTDQDRVLRARAAGLRRVAELLREQAAAVDEQAEGLEAAAG
jgi:hypothetical protein